MYKVITAPTDLAVSLDEIKTQLNLKGFTDDDTYLQLLIRSSTQYVEKYLMMTIPTQTVEMKIYHHHYRSGGVHGSRSIYLPTPTQTIISIIPYTDDTEGDPLDKNDYILDQYSTPHILTPKHGTEWPEVDYYIIRVTCGYDVAQTPEDIKLAIMILAADAYENRVEQIRDRKNSVTRLIEQYRCKQFVSYITENDAVYGY